MEYPSLLFGFSALSLLNAVLVSASREGDRNVGPLSCDLKLAVRPNLASGQISCLKDKENFIDAVVLKLPVGPCLF